MVYKELSKQVEQTEKAATPLRSFRKVRLQGKSLTKIGDMERQKQRIKLTRAETSMESSAGIGQPEQKPLRKTGAEIGKPEL